MQLLTLFLYYHHQASRSTGPDQEPSNPIHRKKAIQYHPEQEEILLSIEIPSYTQIIASIIFNLLNYAGYSSDIQSHVDNKRR